MTAPDWIAVDWGTSALRLWAIGRDGEVIAARRSDSGMAAVPQGGFEAALMDLLDGLLPEAGRVGVLCCGMVGARQGWREAPYVPVPCVPPGMADAMPVPAHDPRLAVGILPGLRQDRPADVMRGEETQVAGFLAGEPHFDGVLCLPGTHTKWVHVSAGEVVSFRTFMTGEMFALLSRGSVLRHAVDPDGWDADAFAEAVGDALSRPHTLSAALFSIRAEGLLAGLDPAQATARLSGLLIGIELAGARPHWLGQDVRVLGTGRMARAYAAALTAQGAQAACLPGEDMALRGLIAARRAVTAGAS